ncbi:helix-turn-helix domain-containing protein [Tsukamurella tyrosinosolvens]|uniref:helix-turn-helix domain-containing protein n=1 Tax=Tsukamurella tyrosinosolvens TaxID=57704 RepID=UPI0007B25A9A|nr:helix-turn-helix transcriptional regulator [Tsukamurella tyrosinosolvens]KZL97723.1 hypothetical protein AXX05_01910 [Tsukamurella tyrosinosolvens]
MTQAELARQMTAGLGHEVKSLIVTRIEGGKRPLTVDELVVIASVLGVDVLSLLEDPGAPVPDVKLQATIVAYRAARDALVSADAARGAAIGRWMAARADLQAALKESGASSSEWMFAGGFDFLGILLGDPDVVRYPGEYPGAMPGDNDAEDGDASGA